MSNIYIFRFIFGEIFSMAAVLYFLFSVLPCRRSKRTAVMIAYIVLAVYIAIMVTAQKSLLSDGMWIRTILFFMEQLVLPCYLIADRTWYRYVSLVIMGDTAGSCLGTVFLMPVYYIVSGGNSALDTMAIQYEMYEKPGSFYVLLIYMVLNFIAYFIMAKGLSKLMEKEKRKKYVLNISLIFFLIEYIGLSFVYMPLDREILRSANIACLVVLDLGLICVVRGMIWEKTDAAKNQQLIGVREMIQYERYLQVQKKQERARKIRHDLADHMLTVKILLEKGETEQAREYVRKFDLRNE